MLVNNSGMIVNFGDLVYRIVGDIMVEKQDNHRDKEYYIFINSSMLTFKKENERDIIFARFVECLETRSDFKLDPKQVEFTVR